MIHQQICRPTFRLLLYFLLSLTCVPLRMGQRTPALPSSLDEAFLTAVQQRAWPKIRQLLAEGANINARSSNNRYYALQYAVYWYDPTLVKFPLDKGADINLTDDGDDKCVHSRFVACAKSMRTCHDF